MSKKVLLFLTLLATVYCAENASSAVMAGESRAKKKKNNLRIWGIILLVLVSKLAIGKTAAALFFWGLFQKFCYVIGLLINYLMLNRKEVKPLPEPLPPSFSDYNTVGYSYGAPESSYSIPEGGAPVPGNAEATSYGAPSPYNSWPYNRRSHKED